MNTIKLDNPAWYSLTETHKEFALDYNGVKFYDPDYCPFGSFVQSADTIKGIEGYASLTGNFFVIGDKPEFSDKV